MHDQAMFPGGRPRRHRMSVAARNLVRETKVAASNLVLPMFVREGIEEPVDITSMPGVVQHTLDTLVPAAQEAVASGVGGIMLFGIPAVRDAEGSEATNPDGILNVALAKLREALGDSTVIIADLCLDEFTDHGHCGLLDEAGNVDNDSTLERYVEMGLAQAQAGAHMLGLSGMMDGQVAAVRAALDEHGFSEVSILAYSAKYASGLYGPFREAVDSQLSGDRRTYQMDPANRSEATREILSDIAEGADIVMVKPGSFYLDILVDAKRLANVPVAAYQVSGEYAMVEAAAANGWINREQVIDESILSFARAGADVIVTYWAVEVANRLNGQ